MPSAGQRGSSPRVRGKRGGCGSGRCRSRLIPARAGPTQRYPRQPSHSPAHPRACGANRPAASSTGSKAGSSPRVRGKPTDCGLGGGNGRLIPARAGQTSDYTEKSRETPAHPRACGANDPGRVDKVLACGSSPRVRGKPGGAEQAGDAVRLIPARAGPTMLMLVLIAEPPAHPRACGANRRSTNYSQTVSGSSPRVRGQLHAASPTPRRCRLIPARAGPTVGSLTIILPRAAHPRACGANAFDLRFHRDVSGSSPRVRGQLRSSMTHSVAFRLIPARAGPTRCPIVR